MQKLFKASFPLLLEESPNLSPWPTKPYMSMSPAHFTNLIFLSFQCSCHIGILFALQMLLLAVPYVRNVVLPNLEILLYSPSSGLAQVSILMVATLSILSKEAPHSHPQHNLSNLCVSFIGLILISNDYNFVFTLYICLNVSNLRSQPHLLCSLQCPSYISWHISRCSIMRDE